jgi:hypothetical protein
MALFGFMQRQGIAGWLRSKPQAETLHFLTYLQ